MNTKTFATVLVLGVVALACNFSLGGGVDCDGDFSDDFSDTGSGWDRVSDTDAVTDYDGDAYRINVISSAYSAWANPNQCDYTDVQVEVDASKTGGPDDNEFGLICRHADIDNFYVATISSDGFYGFLRRVGGGSLELIGMDNMLPNDAIVLGSDTNHIRLDCIGSTLTLYVNGTMVGSATDSTHASGDVGLYAGTFSEGGTDIHFDNFAVHQR